MGRLVFLLKNSHDCTHFILPNICQPTQNAGCCSDFKLRYFVPGGIWIDGLRVRKSVTFRFAQRGPRLFLLAALVCVNPVKWSLSVVGAKSHSVNRVDNNHAKTLDFLSVVIFWLLGVSFFSMVGMMTYTPIQSLFILMPTNWLHICCLSLRRCRLGWRKASRNQQCEIYWENIDRPTVEIVY